MLVFVGGAIYGFICGCLAGSAVRDIICRAAEARAKSNREFGFGSAIKRAKP